MRLDEPLSILQPDGSPSGVVVVPFAVPGKVALWLEDESAGPDFGSVEEDTIALEVRDAGGATRLFYVPACARMSDALAARLEDTTLVWSWLAVAADWRGFGYGGAAVPIVERAAMRLGATSGRALVPASNGIGLYFWLRLGYRPLSGPVTVRIGELTTRTDCIVGVAGSQVLIGQLVLEALDLVADCRAGTVTPRHPEGPVLGLR